MVSPSLHLNKCTDAREKILKKIPYLGTIGELPPTPPGLSICSPGREELVSLPRPEALSPWLIFQRQFLGKISLQRTSNPENIRFMFIELNYI